MSAVCPDWFAELQGTIVKYIVIDVVPMMVESGTDYLLAVPGKQFGVMIECIATDVATMMVDVTDLQFQAEQASGERLDSNHTAATGVKAALHKLVKKYAGDETAERLLGAPAKPRRKSEMLTGRRSRSGHAIVPVSEA